MLLIGIDFDGTIVEHEYPRIGREIPFAIETLKKMQTDLQCRLILWTVREGALLDEAVEYCKAKGLEFYSVNSNYIEEEPGSEPRKLKVDLFVDDRNLGGLPDWGVIYQMVASGNHLKPIPNDSYTENASPKKGLFGSIFSK